MNKNCAKSKFTEYKFLELFITTMAKQKHCPIIDKKVLEEVLYKYYDKPEYKELFEDVVRVNQVDNKRVNLEEAFMTARSFCLLNNINDSTTGRFISNISTDEEIEMILSNHEEDKKITMSKLVKAVYPDYIMGLEYKPVAITEETRQYVIDHPGQHLNCSPRVFNGRFYTDKEWEQKSAEMLSRELPGGKKQKPKVLTKTRNEDKNETKQD